ncbi:MAG: hypothetical protein ACQERT_11820, partial [Thermodesulfobacteriota bacterium]
SFHTSFASGKSEIFLPQSGQKRELAGLISDETLGCPSPSLPGPALTCSMGAAVKHKASPCK